MEDRQERIGIDVGGVVLDFMPYFDTDVSFNGDNYLQTPEIEGAIDSIAELNRGRFKDQVCMVTRYDKNYGPGRVIEWLESKDFFARTGIPMDRYHPCIERYDKTPICINLGITHFIDDRAEVLSHMIDQVPHLYLFKSPDADREEFASLLSRFEKADSWSELMEKLRI
jgi:hypothetical protein